LLRRGRLLPRLRVVVPMMSLSAIFAAGEKSLAACVAFHLPLTEDEVRLAVEHAVDGAIKAVEVTT
jgi:hypothetical protein